ncbi:sugar transferase [Candidatus Saccharibacteria bacterium]|nr:sugar transferase [Candidatus Saccharibacteria bacterium]
MIFYVPRSVESTPAPSVDMDAVLSASIFAETNLQTAETASNRVVDLFVRAGLLYETVRVNTVDTSDMADNPKDWISRDAISGTTRVVKIKTMKDRTPEQEAGRVELKLRGEVDIKDSAVDGDYTAFMGRDGKLYKWLGHLLRKSKLDELPQLMIADTPLVGGMRATDLTDLNSMRTRDTIAKLDDYIEANHPALIERVQASGVTESEFVAMLPANYKDFVELFSSTPNGSITPATMRGASRWDKESDIAENIFGMIEYNLQAISKQRILGSYILSLAKIHTADRRLWLPNTPNLDNSRGSPSVSESIPETA